METRRDTFHKGEVCTISVVTVIDVSAEVANFYYR